jgi:hypothetical protein
MDPNYGLIAVALNGYVKFLLLYSWLNRCGIDLHVANPFTHQQLLLQTAYSCSCVSDLESVNRVSAMSNGFMDYAAKNVLTR